MSTILTPAMRRSALISLLRDPSQWPEGFEWDFNECEQCAMGLGHALLKAPLPNNGDIYRRNCDALKELSKFWGLSEAQVKYVFTLEGYDYVSPRWVTPSIVANMLESIHNQLAEVG